jgi:hypothetical protein
MRTDIALLQTSPLSLLANHAFDASYIAQRSRSRIDDRRKARKHIGHSLEWIAQDKQPGLGLRQVCERFHAPDAIMASLLIWPGSMVPCYDLISAGGGAARQRSTYQPEANDAN